MRSSPWSFGAAALFAFFAFMPMTGALAENIDVDNASAEGSQIEPAGADPYAPSSQNNLNSVPEDGESIRRVSVPDSPFVKKILASRPDEDLVICIAGCYTDRDRVVYAQPSLKLPRASIGPQSMLRSPTVINPSN
jgi:hypothetical protein